MSEPWASRLCALRLVVLAAWCGLTWSIGYVVAPTLFSVLDDRTLAGNLAGELFRIQAWTTVVIAPLLWVSFVSPGLHRFRSSRDAWIILVMLACTSLGFFVLQPLMADVRAAIAVQGRSAALASRFAGLHAVAAALYLVHSLSGVWLVARQSIKMTNT